MHLDQEYSYHEEVEVEQQHALEVVVVVAYEVALNEGVVVDVVEQEVLMWMDEVMMVDVEVAYDHKEFDILEQQPHEVVVVDVMDVMDVEEEHLVVYHPYYVGSLHCLAHVIISLLAHSPCLLVDDVLHCHYHHSCSLEVLWMISE